MTAAALEQGPKPVAAALEQGAKPVAHGREAMVSAMHPTVADAMAEVLRRGGNAMDAVLTAVPLQGVLEPQMTTLAGGMSVLYYDATRRRYEYVDGELDHTTDAPPVAATWDHYVRVDDALDPGDGRRVGVPGTPAGMYEAMRRHGSLGWADYFAPAIHAAEHGFPMYSFLYGETFGAAGRLSTHPSGRAEFLPGGRVPPVGERMVRPALAETMRRIAADGPEHVYRGTWARRFVEAVRATGGTVTEHDLAGYTARVLEPLRTPFRGEEVVAAPPPSAAGVLISLVLRVLEHFDLPALGHYTREAEALEVLRRAVAFGEFFTERFVRDPLSYHVPVGDLLADGFTAGLAALIRGSSRRELAAPGAVATPSAAELHAGNTDHVVAVDAAGNMASLTHTVYGTTFGTGLVVDGIHVNSGNGFPGTGNGPGRRVLSPFPPTMVARDGVPRLVLGSPGLSARAVAIVLANHLGYGLPLAEAIDQPRFQGAQVDQPFTVEARIAPSVLTELADRYGADVRVTTPYYWHFGAVHAIEVDADGTRHGHADPRRPGRAAGW
ncbi:gamma-glutamyltransferase family protein [Micromonospora sp. NPDC007230]|uniref:gamma-glutamyltransferase family protein n=1 Tax=Micromonospora sp. NPDC007230 TaxID=3364237 RepID=UPI0036760D6C